MNEELFGNAILIQVIEAVFLMVDDLAVRALPVEREARGLIAIAGLRQSRSIETWPCIARNIRGLKALLGKPRKRALLMEAHIAAIIVEIGGILCKGRILIGNDIIAEEWGLRFRYRNVEHRLMFISRCGADDLWSVRILLLLLHPSRQQFDRYSV